MLSIQTESRVRKPWTGCITFITPDILEIYPEGGLVKKRKPNEKRFEVKRFQS